ncbi:hypothetical protein I5907_21480 [Panacibacter sp. DH6]|uniref:DUF4837 family protein n=1 Tax=Panacibacter microcysteis TaxID=2793269 RepID=A0A931MFB8_9BACT|nr:hypothetical protein [Panacibacter microcysteis]MBG9378819.1 hypothetical protein [Panacibacter microcysteis]
MRQLKLLFGILLLLSCRAAKAQNDFKIPDQVSISKTASYQQFPGTRVFVEAPKNYELEKQLIRFQKNENTFFQIIESPLTNFAVKKAELVKGFEDAVNTGKIPKEYYKKEFKLDTYDAVLYYGRDNKPNLEQIVLCFGDKDFSVMALGEIPANDKSSRQEVLKALLSLYVDKTIKVDPTALASYSLDVSNTEFQYAGNISQMYYYTIGGKGDPANNPFENEIMVMTLPAMKDKVILKYYAIDMIGRYKLSGMQITAYKGSDTILNGNYAYAITFNGSLKGKSNSVYQIVTGDDQSSLLFVGSAYSRQEELMNQIKTIAKTLRTK